VVRDMRRRWAWAAAWLIGPGICWVGGEVFSGAVGFETDGRLSPKMLAKVCPANDERRTREGGDCGWSSDMMSSELGRSGCGKECRVGIACQVLALRPKHLSNCLFLSVLRRCLPRTVDAWCDKVELQAPDRYQVLLYLNGPFQVYATRLRDKITRPDDRDPEPIYPIEQWS